MIYTTKPPISQVIGYRYPHYAIAKHTKKTPNPYILVFMQATCKNISPALISLENTIIKFFFFTGLIQTIVTTLFVLIIVAPQQIESKKQDLAYLAETSAYVIDGDMHRKLWDEQLGEQSSEYKQIKLTLQNISSYWYEVDSIYTMVKTSDPHTLQFVVDSAVTIDRDGDGRIDPDEQSAQFGEKYDIQMSPLMASGFDYVTVDFVPTTDKWGTFISAYAPIKDSNNEVVAMVGVDLKASHYYELIKGLIISLVKVIVILQILNVFFSIYLSKHILKRFNT
jgi:methyl-accepting chemotaxis protein